MNQIFPEVALVLLAHGSTESGEAADAISHHADQIRLQGRFARVCEAFWRQAPYIRDVLAEVTEPRVSVVPLFMSEGYFTDQLIPAALGFTRSEQAGITRVQRHGAQWMALAEPVGTHPSMASVIVSRAREIVTLHPFPRTPPSRETALFIAGHGTERHEGSRLALEAQASLIRELNLYAEVHTIFLEESPRIDSCYEMTRLPNLIVVPFFISDGPHASQDIPVQLGEPERLVKERLKTGKPAWRNPSEKKNKRVWYTRSVGTDPHLVAVILERAQQACALISQNTGEA